MDVEELIEEVRYGPRGPRIGAFFDFDGTLIAGYSALALYGHRLRNLEINPMEIVHGLRVARSSGPMDEGEFRRLVELGLDAWAGRPEDDILELGERLWRTEIAGMLVHETFRLVQAHQRMGHTVAIATSATRMQVAPLARELGIEHVLCTELETERGLVTGRVAGRTLWGPGKLAAVTDFCKRRRITRSASFAYGNGDEDIPYLAGVGHPVAVNPQRLLATEAQARGWPVIRTDTGPGRLDLFPPLRTAAMYNTLIWTCLAGIGIGAVTGEGRRGKDFATEAFGVLSGPVGNVQVAVTGKHNAWSHRPAVFLINHQSALIDLVVVTQVLRTGITAVAKKEVKSIPVVGQLMTWLDFAYIDRGNTGQAMDAMAEAVDRLRAGISIVISPEGTRSYTPQVGPFKKGAFHLAMQAGVPIVPIVIRNAGQLMWRGAKVARSGTVEVHVHEPIPTTGWTKADLDAAVLRVHDLYVETLTDWAAVTGAGAPSPAVTKRGTTR